MRQILIAGRLEYAALVYAILRAKVSSYDNDLPYPRWMKPAVPFEMMPAKSIKIEKTEGVLESHRILWTYDRVVK
jgi:hypothetical protein